MRDLGRLLFRIKVISVIFFKFFTFYLPNCCQLNTFLDRVDFNSFSDTIVAGNNYSVKPVRFYVLPIETNLEPSIPNCEKNKIIVVCRLLFVV